MNLPHPRLRAERYPWIWAAVCAVLIIAVASLSLALYSAQRAADVASCINTNLGQRSKPTARDAAAHIGFAQAVDALFDVPPDATDEQRAKVALKFKAEVHAYVRVLLADQRARERTPLGRC